MKRPPIADSHADPNVAATCLTCKANTHNDSLICKRCERKLRSIKASKSHQVDRFLMRIIGVGRAADRYKWFSRRLRSSALQTIASEMSAGSSKFRTTGWDADWENLRHRMLSFPPNWLSFKIRCLFKFKAADKKEFIYDKNVTSLLCNWDQLDPKYVKDFNQHTPVSKRWHRSDFGDKKGSRQHDHMNWLSNSLNQTFKILLTVLSII